ncbi:MAG: hypothetical protein LBS77_02055 [Desulfovibrio sp.]|jgi:hypothetical protein|nr:hypothetical protein [Desulfovibrio sp.]
MKLTDTVLRSLKNTNKAQKHTDGGSIPVYFSLWRMDYRCDKKRKTLSFGAYPCGIFEVRRQEREDAKEQLARGIDPGVCKKAAKEAVRAEKENTFEVIAREWFMKRKDTWVDAHAEKIIRRL